MRYFARRALPRFALVLACAAPACQSMPEQSYPWPGTVSIGLIPGGPWEPALGIHAYSMPDPDGIGTWYQLSFDPAQFLYSLYAGTPDHDEWEDDPNYGDYSFSQEGATVGFGFGAAKNLGDRVLLFAGAGYALAFEHAYERDRRGYYDYDEEEHLHYLTSGPNLTAGLQWRVTPAVGVELGYQSFYETWYLGAAFPF